MKRIVVSGGNELNGEISVSGSKNAALPIIFACILTNGISEIENLPDIGDVRVALRILECFGASVERKGDITYIDTRRLSYSIPDVRLVSNIRASTYLIGSCLSRFGKCHIQSFGGCNFSLRPIDMHIDACLALGARQIDNMIVADRLCGSEISFRQPSVGATVNAILLSASADGESLIKGCAVEPHIDALIDFLNSAGADIVRRNRELVIKGSRLHGGRIRVIGDMIEAGSYLVLGTLSGGSVKLIDPPIDNMASILSCLEGIGAEPRITDGKIEIEKPSKINRISILASPYPGFPTDLQPIFAPLMAAGRGGSITDEVWRSRFGYLSSLSPLGVDYSVSDNIAEVYPSKIKNGITTATDLRGGMACLITSLCTRGQSEIDSAEIILRGYENLENKLSALGADIKIIDY